MTKFFSLVRAMFSQDMNPFRYRAKSKTPMFGKVGFFALLVVIMFVSAGAYAFLLAKPLSEYGLTFVMLTLFLAALTLFCFIEGIYKSQSILFDCHDNDLLFSLPVKKHQILALRVVKLVVFQIVFNALFLIPAFAVYAFFEQPGAGFYALSALMLILVPLIPTALAIVVGYLVRLFSSHFRRQKFWQIALSLAAFLALFFLGFNLDSVLADLAANADSINAIITKLYYPIGAYLELINHFELGKFLLFLVINILPLLLVVLLGSASYFRVISRTRSVGVSTHHKVQRTKAQPPLLALIKKEFARYFSSPAYVLNTIFGLLMMVIIAVLFAINHDNIVQLLIPTEEAAEVMAGEIPPDVIYAALPVIFLQLLILMSCFTSITSSSISIEGKTLALTKSLPVSPQQIFTAKILMSNIIVIPFLLLADLIFCIAFTPAWPLILALLCATIIFPTLTAIIGLLMNLRFPKLDADSDAEIIKQSVSMLVSLGIGLVITAVCTLIVVIGYQYVGWMIALELLLAFVLMLVAWHLLKTLGTKLWHKL